ncbi:ABC transporter permease [Paralcaligenes sp. KSB-10]|uniref:ABC transporter permease n=1 Tax=Paralcaligenes sp. KSB-10 TaxID=2901142 RepID=UPI001E3626FA|nr:ABC transporter permease [Paralcaligenes sp. KSB-10]UHL65974.1 ABC transporter permease [Paralcaligenes sp. KSB-10]
MTATITNNDAHAIRHAMRAAERKRKWRAFFLVAPLALFLLVIFVIPIGALLQRAVENPEVIATLPKTLETLKGWDGSTAPSDAAYAALAADLGKAKGSSAAGGLARRLNYEIPGYRSLIFKTIRRMPLTGPDGKTLSDADIRTRLIQIDKHWSELPFWQAIASNNTAYSPYYLLASLDLKQNAKGDIVRAPAGTSAFLDIFGRTFLISAVVTILTLILGFPLAYWITTLSKRRANLVIICILIPFWTSVLVRIAAWIVLLQRQGLVNKALISTGITDAPIALLFNRVGVYIAMTHILLPFMILPIFSVMQSVPNTCQRAAISLGSHPFAAFWRVYVPQTYPGIGAGTLLVFIIAIGYYITPALLGGASDQMISYYVAYFTNQTINWGMASALGFILLIGTLLLYSLYRRLSGRELGLG